MSRHVSLPRVERLLKLATHHTKPGSDLADRRHRFLAQVGELLGATSGFWGWGRGNPIDTHITPVAALCFGFTEAEWQAVIEMSLGPDSVRLWSVPIRERMAGCPQVTVTRSMLHSDAAWEAEIPFRSHLARLGIEHLLVSVNYFNNDSWFSITMCRGMGRDDFAVEDADLLSLAVTGVAWMQPRLSETLPPESFAKLTARQRTVILGLLDGKSRKQLARRLGISLHTLNDHVKAIYEHFQVKSVSELAARFLQSS
jgi:DNA-binding CsgD family transcriptional regulator